MKVEQKDRPEQRGINAPFFVYSRLEDTEKYICCRLVTGAGPLGWNRRSINAAHLRFSSVEALVEKGVVRRVSLFQLAQELVGNEDSRERKTELDKDGGFLALTNEDDRNFFRSFDMALEIVKSGKISEYSEERYQVARRDLYHFIDMLL